jgi:uncharacterized membrane protein YsdA (DUF1294 family)
MSRPQSLYRNPLVFECGMAVLTLAAVLLLALKCGIYPVWSYLLAINFFTFSTYAYDKWSAPREGRRVPERTLHLFAALGGTPAALAGQYFLHHKNRKRSFQIRFWLIMAAQAALLIGWIWWWRRSQSGH